MPNLPAPGGTDVWGADLNAAIESLHQSGTHAARPTTDLVEGTLYACTTHGTIERWDGAAWTDWTGLGGGVTGQTGGSDTSVIGTSTSVAAATTSALYGTSAITPAADSLIFIEASANVSNASGVQGAYISPFVFTDMDPAGSSSDNERVAGASSNAQLVQTPLNATINGWGFYFLKAGRTYKIGYDRKVGTGPQAVTFTQVQASYTLTPLPSGPTTKVVVSNGQVLNGGLTLLKKVTLSAATAQIDLTAADLPEGYDSLMIDVTGRGDTAANEVGVNLLVNGDTGANYRTKFHYASTGVEDKSASNTSFAMLGWILGATATAGGSGHTRVLIPDYKGSVFHKSIEADFETVSTSGESYNGKVSTQWRNTAPITSLTLKPNAGNFAAGTVVAVYGVGGPGSIKTGVDPNETWKDYTPTLVGDGGTNPTLGTGGVAEGRYSHVGNTVKGWARIKAGTAGTTAGVGWYSITLPKPVANAFQRVLGPGKYNDSSAGSNIMGQVFPGGGGCRLWIGSDYAGQNNPAGGLAVNDEIAVWFEYETTEYNPVVVPVQGSTSTMLGKTLATDWVNSTTLSAWAEVEPLTQTFTPEADGYVTFVGRTYLKSTSTTGGIWMRGRIAPTPVSGTAEAGDTGTGVSASTSDTLRASTIWEVKAGVTYTVYVETWTAGTATVTANDDYTSSTLLFTPKAVGIASSDQIPQLLAVKTHNPTAQAFYPFGTSDADFDASNLAVTFVAPASGKVLVKFEAVIDFATNVALYASVREGSTQVSTTEVGYTGSTSSRRVVASFMVEGLTPGSTHTYKVGGWKAGSGAGSATVYTYAGGGVSGTGPAVLEVWDAQPVPVSGVIPWIDLTLASGISSKEAEFGHRPQYRRVGDEVQLRGVLKKTTGSFSGGTDTDLFTLPAGYRPGLGAGSAVAADPTKIAAGFSVITDTGTARGRILIYGDGRVQYTAGDLSTWVPLDQIRFSVLP